MVNVRTNCNDQAILMRLHYQHELVCVCLVPEDLELIVPVISKENMRLCDELFVRVCVEHLFNPNQLLNSSVMIFKVFLERVHAIDGNNNRVIA